MKGVRHVGRSFVHCFCAPCGTGRYFCRHSGRYRKNRLRHIQPGGRPNCACLCHCGPGAHSDFCSRPKPVCRANCLDRYFALRPSFWRDSRHGVCDGTHRLSSRINRNHGLCSFHDGGTSPNLVCSNRHRSPGADLVCRDHLARPHFTLEDTTCLISQQFSLACQTPLLQ